jgi:hypothetical protein
MSGLVAIFSPSWPAPYKQGVGACREVHNFIARCILVVKFFSTVRDGIIKVVEVRWAISTRSALVNWKLPVSCVKGPFVYLGSTLTNLGNLPKDRWTSFEDMTSELREERHLRIHTLAYRDRLYCLIWRWWIGEVQVFCGAQFSKGKWKKCCSWNFCMSS